MRAIYLDHNATTPVRAAVADAMMVALRELTGNPSSVHRSGQAARNAIEGARESVAALIGASAREIVFTSGATEANQLALLSTLRAGGAAPVVVSSAAEHPSVLAALAARAADAPGLERVLLPLDGQGRLEVAALEAALAATPETRPVLVSLMLVQNELGNLYAVRELARVARRRGALVHCDATQAVGRIAVDVEALGVDLLSLSGHKLGGPKGVGALYVRRGVELGGALVRGGHQERGRRAGTENVPGIVGLGVACELAAREGLADWPRVVELAGRLGAGIAAAAGGVHWLGDRSASVGNTCCLAIEGVAADVLLVALDLAGVAVSAGSACASGSLEPSPVLLAMGVAPQLARRAVRFSVGWSNTAEEIERAIATTVAEIAHLRAVAAAHGQEDGR